MVSKLQFAFTQACVFYLSYSRMVSRRCSRKNRKQGGGAYQFTGASIASPGTVNNFGQVHAGSHSGTPDCSVGVKSDTLGFTGSPALPGMQSGGRYGFDLTAPLGGGTPFSSGIPQVTSIPCESSRQSGGASDNVAYYAPTAGYDNKPSGWVGGTGAPVMIQAPYAAGAMNPACLKTGGSRRGRKARKTRNRKTRKGRKGNKRR